MSKYGWKTIRIQYTNGIPSSDNLLEYFQKTKRLIVQFFPKDKLVDGMIPVGLLVLDIMVQTERRDDKVLVKTGRRGLYRVKRCRRWVKGGESFLVDFELATEEEKTVHEVMTG